MPAPKDSPIAGEGGQKEVGATRYQAAPSFGIPKLVCVGFARGQDGLAITNFSKNNKSISIIKQSYKWNYTTEYAGIDKLKSLTASPAFRGKFFPQRTVLPDQILPKVASVDFCTSIDFADNSDVMGVASLIDRQIPAGQTKRAALSSRPSTFQPT